MGDGAFCVCMSIINMGSAWERVEESVSISSVHDLETPATSEMHPDDRSIWVDSLKNRGPLRCFTVLAAMASDAHRCPPVRFDRLQKQPAMPLSFDGESTGFS